MVKRSSYHLENETTFIRKQDIVAHLKQLGIQKGMLLLVHADTQLLGSVLGGMQAVVEALMEVVGYEGTIVMPSFTPQLKDPACIKERIDRQVWDDVREGAYAFDKKLSEPMDSDPLVYQFLRNDAVARSYHPLYSFAAWGKYAKLICDKHPLHFALGKDSPLGKVFDLNGYCVMLGCGYEACSMFQMARYNGELFPIRVVSVPIETNKETKWKALLDVAIETKNFDEIGEVMEEKHIVKTEYVGNGKSLFFSAREAYTIATAYFAVHRRSA